MNRVLEYIWIKCMTMNGYIKYLRKKGAQIGCGCEIYKSANFGSEPYLISIGDHVRINIGVQLITHDGGVWTLRGLKNINGLNCSDIDVFGRITIGNNVSIGTNAIIMPGVNIGDNSIIGCGAIVTHDVRANTVVAGVPAKEIETVEEYAMKNQNRFVETKHMSKKEKRDYLESNF